MTEIRSWVTGVLAVVTVVIALGAGVQIARTDAVQPVSTVVVPPVPAPPTSSRLAASQAVPPPTTSTSARKSPSTASTPTPTPITRSVSVDRSRCTNRIDYSDDPRDNATINSIGAETGRCPAPVSVYQEGSDRTLVEDQRSIWDANGETYAEACRRMGYEPGPTCPAA